MPVWCITVQLQFNVYLVCTVTLFMYHIDIPSPLQEELEQLNEASAEINRLELLLDVSTIIQQRLQKFFTGLVTAAGFRAKSAVQFHGLCFS